MKDYLMVHRDKERESMLKEIIMDIEKEIDHIDENLLEDKFAKANSLITNKEKVLDAYTVRYYHSWTSLDGLVGELMMNVPQIDNIEKTDLIELIHWMRKIISDEEELEGIDYEYFDNYYRSFFELNFPNGAVAYDAIFEEISAEVIIEIAYSNATTDSVILL